MKTHKKVYAEEFRRQVVELIKAGRTPKEVAEEFGCHVTTVRDWMKQNGVIQGVLPNESSKLVDREREELQRLRKEVRQLKIERDILAKATAWFAKRDEGDAT